MGEKPQPNLFFSLCKREQKAGKSALRLCLHCTEGMGAAGGSSPGVRGGTALSWGRAGARPSLPAPRAHGGSALQERTFSGKEWFVHKLETDALKVFCLSSFPAPHRNLVTFRLPVAENFPYKCMDDTGE